MTGSLPPVYISMMQSGMDSRKRRISRYIPVTAALTGSAVVEGDISMLRIVPVNVQRIIIRHGCLTWAEGEPETDSIFSFRSKRNMIEIPMHPITPRE